MTLHFLAPALGNDQSWSSIASGHQLPTSMEHDLRCPTTLVSIWRYVTSASRQKCSNICCQGTSYTPSSEIPVRHHQHWLHCWTSRVPWLQCNNEHCGLCKQGVPFYSNTYHNYSLWGSLPTCLETAWTSKAGHVWLRSIVYGGVDTEALPATCYRLSYWRPLMELLSPMTVMLEGLGFNLCAVPFLNVCVPNLPQGRGQRLVRSCWSWVGDATLGMARED